MIIAGKKAGGSMSHIKLRALIAVAIGLSLTGLAQAQAQNPLSPEKGLWNRPDYDRIYTADRIDEEIRRELTGLHRTATDALDAKNYAAAETTLRELVGRAPTTTDAHFLMGLAKIGLGKWDEARTSLEAAVQKEPARPEPKTRASASPISSSTTSRPQNSSAPNSPASILPASVRALTPSGSPTASSCSTRDLPLPAPWRRPPIQRPCRPRRSHRRSISIPKNTAS
jgi:tetratricopeptide (TPR) repeat protein